MVNEIVSINQDAWIETFFALKKIRKKLFLDNKPRNKHELLSYVAQIIDTVNWEKVDNACDIDILFSMKKAQNENRNKNK